MATSRSGQSIFIQASDKVAPSRLWLTKISYSSDKKAIGEFAKFEVVVEYGSKHMGLWSIPAKQA